MGLINDAKILAKAGYSKTSGALNLISNFSEEKEYLVWDQIVGTLSSISTTWWEQGEEVSEA